LLFLPLGCGGNDGGPLGVDEPALVLQPSELCSDHSEHDIATFEDANLEARIKVGVGFPYDDLDAESLTCAMVSALTNLQGPVGIESLVGIQNLTGLTTVSLDHGSFTDLSPLSGLTNLEGLRLNNNSISDISPLSGHTSLTDLTLFDNPISEISALSGLTGLEVLSLGNNSITDISALNGLTSLKALHLESNLNLTDIQPLLDNTGLGMMAVGQRGADSVGLLNTNVSCTDLALLEAKGVDVSSDCP